MEEITVTCRSQGGVLQFTVDGPMLVTTAWRLRAEVDRALRAHDMVRLEVDLAGVPLLDSSGISALIVCLTAAHSAGRHLAVTNPRPSVYRALEVLGLLEALHVAESSPGGGGATAEGGAPRRPGHPPELEPTPSPSKLPSEPPSTPRPTIDQADAGGGS